MKAAFDKRFGPDFLDHVPHEPGVYRFFDGKGGLLYVGKAVDLRRRLAQYRNASRKKAHRKMCRIVGKAHRLEFQIVASEQEALLLEDAIIKTERPKLNKAGAYSFLYPFFGLRRGEDGDLYLAQGTDTALLDEASFEIFGCYRNRLLAKEGFAALINILEHIAHRDRPSGRIEYTQVRRFRQVPRAFDEELRDFLLGESDQFLTTLFSALLDRPRARRSAAFIQEQIEAMRVFFDAECSRFPDLLAQVDGSFIDQEERDAAAIRSATS